MKDGLTSSPPETSMKQRLRNAVKMAQERIAVQGHAYDVEEFMRDVPAPPIISGEVVPTEAERGDGEGGWAIRDTLATPHTAAIAASLERTELLSEGYTGDVLALGIDAAESVGGNNSLEKMLAHQMALAHKTAFRLIKEGMARRDTDEMARLAEASARMMTAYQQGLLTLNRLRTGGKQTVTVQHANVGNGGHARWYRRLWRWLTR